MLKATGWKVKKDCNRITVKFLSVQHHNGCRQDIMKPAAGSVWDSGHKAENTDLSVSGIKNSGSGLV